MNPLSGQANLVENIIFSNFRYFFGKVSFSYSTNNSPLARFIAVSTLSANLFPSEEFNTILSTSTDKSCFTFLFNSGTFSISYRISSILIFLNPLFLKPKISFLYSPFLPLTTGANKYIVDFLGNSLILSTICVIVCD